MLLNKLESGFLLLHTQQGFVAVEPSTFWQRAYLLWTFRNFRELSPSLLNARQSALINDLFRRHAAVLPHEYEPSLQIGLVEDFVPPAIEIAPAPSVKSYASRAPEAKLHEQTALQYAAPPVIPIASAPAINAASAPAVIKEIAEMQGMRIDRAETAPDDVPDSPFEPTISRLRLASSNLATSRLAAFRLQVSRIAILRSAAALGALSLCAGFIVAFHRTAPAPTPVAENPAPVPEATPPAPDSPLPDSSSAPAPTSVAENSAPAPRVAPPAYAAPVARVKPAPGKIASSIAPAVRMTTPQHASRRVTAGVAPRSNKAFHAVAFSRIPTSTFTRRTAFAPAFRGPMALSAQSYFELADLEMHTGNYAAAAANYKRAWQIEQNRAAARGRLARARRAMQAKKKRFPAPH